MSETTTTPTTPPTSPTSLRRHPGRGLLWSIPLGLGVVLILLVTKVIQLSLVPVIVVFCIVVVLGTAWGTFGPAKAPKGPPPPPATDAEPEVSRFDDFTGELPRDVRQPPTEAPPAEAPPAEPTGDGGDGGDGGD